MRYLTSIIFLIFLIHLPLFANAAIKGNLEYSVPIDYAPINETEISERAEYFYNQAIISTDGKLNENITSALNLYSILSNKNPQCIVYAIRLGYLYDIIGKDRYAKGNYYRAMGIDKTNPQPYFYLGEFFYKREQYRRALKFYKEAYNLGYSNDVKTNNRLQELYKKLGDKQNQ